MRLIFPRGASAGREPLGLGHICSVLLQSLVFGKINPNGRVYHEHQTCFAVCINPKQLHNRSSLFLPRHSFSSSIGAVASVRR